MYVWVLWTGSLTPDVLTTRLGSLEGLHLDKGNASGNHVYLGF
jgi:hypothetical protein